MKKVNDMSVQDMEGYFRNVERLKRVFHRSYRIFWPFVTFSPFSPSRIVLNFGVMMSWVYLLIWAVQGASSPENLFSSLAGLWITVLVMYLLIGLIERHYRIKRRYRQLTGSRFHFRMPWHSRPETHQRVYYETNRQPEPTPQAEENPSKKEEDTKKNADDAENNPLRELLIKIFR